jgi:hypothetical protein
VTQLVVAFALREQRLWIFLVTLVALTVAAQGYAKKSAVGEAAIAPAAALRALPASTSTNYRFSSTWWPRLPLRPACPSRQYQPVLFASAPGGLVVRQLQRLETARTLKIAVAAAAINYVLAVLRD